MRVINIDTDFGVFCVDSNRRGAVRWVGEKSRSIVACVALCAFGGLALCCARGYCVGASMVVLVVVVCLGFRVKPNRVTTARVFLHNIM